MNRGRLIGGLICLILAGILAVLYVVLPPDSMMFTVGESNMPWVPALILGIVGVLLLATAFRGEGETTQATPEEVR